jgi:plasmid stabilization system protein ParE
VKVKITTHAEKRIEIVDRFWRKNRLEAPNLLKEELSAAEARLREDPYAGTVCIVRGKKYLRLLLPKTEQWLYYRVHSERALVVVQTIWGARRGRDPKL